jgi:hypothetical protein
VEDPIRREIYDDFPADNGIHGVSNNRSNWQAIVREDTMVEIPQTLPGPGNQLEISLATLLAGESSYFETEPSGPAGGTELQPEGSALRFWFDPSEVMMAPNTQFALAATCGPTPPCGAAQVRYRRKPDGNHDLLVTALLEDGSFLAIPSGTLPAGPHTVEVRMRNAAAPGLDNGWFELWIDGDLVDRRERLANHDQQADFFRFGVLNDMAGSSGTLVLDELEAWRFD